MELLCTCLQNGDAGKDTYMQGTNTGQNIGSSTTDNHEHRTQRLQENSPASVMCISTRTGAILLSMVQISSCIEMPNIRGVGGGKNR